MNEDPARPGFTRRARILLGTGTAFAASLPWLEKNELLVRVLSVDGVNSPTGYTGDLGTLLVSEIALFLPATLVLLAISRLALGFWHGPALWVLGVLLTSSVAQDAAVVVMSSNVKECGFAYCIDGRLNAVEAPPVVRTLPKSAP